MYENTTYDAIRNLIMFLNVLFLCLIYPYYTRRQLEDHIDGIVYSSEEMFRIVIKTYFFPPIEFYLTHLGLIVTIGELCFFADMIY